MFERLLTTKRTLKASDLAAGVLPCVEPPLDCCCSEPRVQPTPVAPQPLGMFAMLRKVTFLGGIGDVVIYTAGMTARQQFPLTDEPILPWFDFAEWAAEQFVSLEAVQVASTATYTLIHDDREADRAKTARTLLHCCLLA